MSTIKGTVVVTGQITPGDTLDDFAVQDAQYGRDGYRTVDNKEEMYAIKKPRRRVGMIVGVPVLDGDGLPVLNPQNYPLYELYQLSNNPSSAQTSQSDWHLLDFGEGSGDLNYVHTQASPATIWTIYHNLGKKPAIFVSEYNSPGIVSWPAIEYVDDNTAKIYIGRLPFAGYAYCN